jgi:hypothetical protein
MTSPLKGPWSFSASIVNCEHVGICRHDCGVHGDINPRYNHTGISSKKDNIFAAVFNIVIKDTLNHHDKMTCLINKMTMAEVLK